MYQVNLIKYQQWECVVETNLKSIEDARTIAQKYLYDCEFVCSIVDSDEDVIEYVEYSDLNKVLNKINSLEVHRDRINDEVIELIAKSLNVELNDIEFDLIKSYLK